MSALAETLRDKMKSRTRPNWRGRPGLRRTAARGGAREGRLPRDRHRPGRAKGAGDQRRALLHSRRGHRGRAGALARRQAGRDRPTSPSSRELDTINICVPDAAAQDEGSRHVVHRVGRRRASPGTCIRACSIVLESTTYPGNDRRSRPADARSDGPQGWRRFLPRVFARARRSRAIRRSRRTTCPKVVGGVTPDLRRARARSSTARRSRRSCR